MNKKKPNLLIPIMLCCTLGLAPFFPEPHIWGKIHCMLGGADGMTWSDWFDLLLHGSPWIWLTFILIKRYK